MAGEIYEHGVDTKVLFTIELAKDGTYFAVRNGNPSFAFQGSSPADVAGQADRALHTFQRLEHFLEDDGA